MHRDILKQQDIARILVKVRDRSDRGQDVDWEIQPAVLLRNVWCWSHFPSLLRFFRLQCNLVFHENHFFTGRAVANRYTMHDNVLQTVARTVFKPMGAAVCR